MNRRPVHTSWLIAWLSSGVLLGVALVASSFASFAGVEWLLLAALLIAVTFQKQTRFMIVVALAGGIVLGLWRGSVAAVDLAAYATFYHTSVTLKGIVAQDTEVGERGDQRLRLDQVHIGNTPLPGHVLVSTSTQADIKRGDKVTVAGQLDDGFGAVPATMYRATLKDVVRPQPGDAAREVRDWFASQIRAAIPEPQASLGIGYLVGQRSALPEDLMQQLQLLGLTHIIVASGYNLTILVRLARQLFEQISKYMAAVSASLLIAAFILVTGLSPSMSRAGLVAGLSLAAWYYGRTIHPLVLLPFSAAITVLANPSYLWGDIGWYLSFASFVGVILFAPLVRHRLWGEAKVGAIKRILVETASAQLLTMPIIAFVFSQYAPLALPANLLILPLIPFVMLFTFIAGLVAAICPPLAVTFGLPASATLWYMTSVTEWLAATPWAAGEIEFGITALIGSYVAIAAVLLWLWRSTRHSFANESIVQ